MSGWEVLADKLSDDFTGVMENHDLLLASESELRDVYSIPSAFSRYTEQIHTEYLK